MAARVQQGYDVLSALPRDILEKIFDMITIGDAAKFGVLSWGLRETWCSNPRLVVDRRFIDECINDKEDYESVLLEKLSGISFLSFDGSFLKVLASTTMIPNCLSSLLCRLRHLSLSMVSLDDSVQLSSSLALIKSSLNLETLHVQACSYGDDAKAHEPICMKSATKEMMPHIRMVKMFGLRGLKAELLLIGTIISSSPQLENIFLEFKVDRWQELVIGNSLLGTGRASRKVSIKLRTDRYRGW